ncbi:branched-chain amino acid transport system ATP-binding protein [Azospirillum fermentarium]|uniref:ABC transporter ATP-binding protein n=1 Tax=Azospirillum fermentarium TaxID=1233114 RepID=UPI002225E109|nr:ABC transporter ATP-binding protein [Azospirillum fermentarium]MCW2248542.1 branched-chain amino acid transport system ATP-binding protein [Azospirillum fermentarium]
MTDHSHDTPAADVLVLDDVQKHFGGLQIMRGVNLAVRRGERHAILGPNGAGKSTLFNLISGAFPPTSGRIMLNGRPIQGLAPERINRLGLARSFQITNIFGRMSTFENLRIGVMARQGVRFGLFSPVASNRRLNEEARHLLDLVRLSKRADTPAADLTYSEQRALEIGMTLATGPEVILLDEPTAGMSREETAYMVELIRDVTQGKTLLMVEHDMSVVFSLCDRISVLVYGAILATGTPDEIRANRAVQEAYLGEELAGEAA